MVFASRAGRIRRSAALRVGAADGDDAVVGRPNPKRQNIFRFEVSIPAPEGVQPQPAAISCVAPLRDVKTMLIVSPGQPARQTGESAWDARRDTLLSSRDESRASSLDRAKVDRVVPAAKPEAAVITPTANPAPPIETRADVAPTALIGSALAKANKPVVVEEVSILSQRLVSDWPSSDVSGQGAAASIAPSTLQKGCPNKAALTLVLSVFGGPWESGSVATLALGVIFKDRSAFGRDETLVGVRIEAHRVFCGDFRRRVGVLRLARTSGAASGWTPNISLTKATALSTTVSCSVSMAVCSTEIKNNVLG